MKAFLTTNRTARTLSAVGEAIFLIFLSTLFLRAVSGALGLPDIDALLALEGGEPDFLAAAIAQFEAHALRYGFLIATIFLVAWWRRVKTRTAYSLTTGGHSLKTLVGVGVLVGIFGTVPVNLLMVVDEMHSLGPGTPFWQLMDRVEWDWTFWLYMAASSYLLVPVVEEIVARGYMLGRMREVLSTGGAVVLISLFFAFVHAQYLDGTILGTGTLISVILTSLLWGYVTVRTGSLIPAMVSHAIINVPIAGTFQVGMLVLALVLLVVFWGSVKRWFADFAALMKQVDDWGQVMIAFALVLAVVAVLVAAPQAAPVLLVVLGALFAASLLQRNPASSK